jgi:hypothetical protein
MPSRAIDSARRAKQERHSTKDNHRHIAPTIHHNASLVAPRTADHASVLLRSATTPPGRQLAVTQAQDCPDHNRMQSGIVASERTYAPVATALGDQKDDTDRAVVTNPLLQAVAAEPTYAPGNCGWTRTVCRPTAKKTTQRTEATNASTRVRGLAGRSPVTLAREASIPIGLKMSGKNGLKETGTASTVHTAAKTARLSGRSRISNSDPSVGRIREVPSSPNGLE